MMASSPIWMTNRELSLKLQGTNVIILMYDITNADSLNYLSKVVQEVNELLEKGNFPILLVGNKSDLKKNRDLSKEQVKKFKIENKITKSMEISIKTEENLEKMFTRLTRMAIKSITSKPRPQIKQTDFRRDYVPVESQKLKRPKSEKDNTLGWILVLLMIGLTSAGFLPGLIVLLGFAIILILYYFLR
jgi:GTPase SAR1 family protein